MSSPVPRYILRRAVDGLRQQVSIELRTMAASAGATPEIIAARLGCSPRRVRRMLFGTADLTLRDIGELAWAMDCRPGFAIGRPGAGDA